LSLKKMFCESNGGLEIANRKKNVSKNERKLITV
jgi:hypothetical protein